MTARIISFVEARNNLMAARTQSAQIDLKESIANSSSSRSRCTNSMPKNTDNDKYKLFVANMNTRRAEFMFPSILSGYRRGINPVDALYNNLQKVLFNYDKDDKMCVWVTDLFKDHVWTDRLCLAIAQDCKDIERFQLINAHDTKAITDLERIRVKFLHYGEVFKLMKTWTDQN